MDKDPALLFRMYKELQLQFSSQVNAKSWHMKVGPDRTKVLSSKGRFVAYLSSRRFEE